jgi:heat shock protein HtpX
VNYFRTTVLLAALTAVLVSIGDLLGGADGALIALGFAGLFNLHTYWRGDVVALRAHQARDARSLREANVIEAVVNLAQNAGIPMPRVYFCDSQQPNAFAVGRSPQTASLLISTGLLDRLDRDEILGVLAHELAHRRARDTLTMTVAATLAGAVAMLGIFGVLIGAVARRNGGLFAIVLGVFTVLAAVVIQCAIGRGREYAADEAGAQICGHPHWIASALRKLDKASKVANVPAEMNPATAPLFFVNPLRDHWAARLFDTHPPVAKRIARLQAMGAKITGEACRR